MRLSLFLVFSLPFHMPLSNYEKKRRFDLAYGDGSYTQAGTYYIGLFTSSPNAGGGGTECVIGTNAYARASVTTNNTNFPAATLGSPLTNGTAIAFPAPTGAWGTGSITHFAVFDASTGGNMIEYGTLSVPLSITTAGTAPTIPVGGLTFDSQ